MASAARIIRPDFRVHEPTDVEVIELASRRPTARQNRGRQGKRSATASAAPSTPLTIISSVPVVAWWRGDLDVALSGSSVSAFGDQSGNGFHLVQGTTGAQPVYNAASPTFNNRPTLTFDGADDQLQCASLAIPLPGTTPRQYHMWYRPIAWGINRAYWGGDATGCQQVFMTTSSPRVQIYNGSGGALNLTGGSVGNMHRMRALFTGSASDHLVIGSVGASGSAGNALSASIWTLGSNNTAGSNANFELAEMLITGGAISAGEETALQAYAAALYTAAVYA